MSVIVSSRNRPALLFDTVQSVLAGDRVPSELVIVDQSDSPNLELRALVGLTRCRIRYLQHARPGASVARNYGASVASEELLVFLDDDLAVDRAWLSAIFAQLSAHAGDVIVTGQVRQEASASLGRFAPSCTDQSGRMLARGRIARDLLSSGNMGLCRAVFQAVRGFDERLGPGARFPAAEDNDLAFRLLETGYSIVYLPEALVWHRAWRDEGDVVGLQWSYGRGQGAFYAKHLATTAGFMWHRALRDVTRPLRTLPERVRSRRARRLLGDFAYAAGILVGLAQWRAAYP